MTNQVDFQKAADKRASLLSAKEQVAKRSPLKHLLYVFVFLFHLEFLAAVGSIALAIQRMFEIGVYSKGGHLDQLGIKWKTK